MKGQWDKESSLLFVAFPEPSALGLQKAHETTMPPPSDQILALKILSLINSLTCSSQGCLGNKYFELKIFITVVGVSILQVSTVLFTTKIIADAIVKRKLIV